MGKFNSRRNREQAEQQTRAFQARLAQVRAASGKAPEADGAASGTALQGAEDGGAAPLPRATRRGGADAVFRRFLRLQLSEMRHKPGAGAMKVSMAPHMVETIADLLEDLGAADEDELELMDEASLSGETAQHLSRALRDLGFRDEHVRQASLFVLRREDGQLDGKGHLLSLALDWLVLHVEPRLLPRCFTAGQRSIEIVRNEQRRGAPRGGSSDDDDDDAGSAAGGGASASRALSAWERAVVGALERFGFGKGRAQRALEEARGDEARAMALLLREQLARACGAELAHLAGARECAATEREAAAAARAEEAGALRAILGPAACALGPELQRAAEGAGLLMLDELDGAEPAPLGGAASARAGDQAEEDELGSEHLVLTLEIADLEIAGEIGAEGRAANAGGHGVLRVRLHCFHGEHAGWHYPLQPPLVAVRCAALLPRTNRALTRQLLLEGARRVAAAGAGCAGAGGEPQLYDLCDWLRQQMPRLLRSLRAVGEAKAPAAADAADGAGERAGADAEPSAGAAPARTTGGARVPLSSAEYARARTLRRLEEQRAREEAEAAERERRVAQLLALNREESEQRKLEAEAERAAGCPAAAGSDGGGEASAAERGVAPAAAPETAGASGGADAAAPAAADGAAVHEAIARMRQHARASLLSAQRRARPAEPGSAAQASARLRAAHEAKARQDPQYARMLRARAALPAAASEGAVLRALRAHRVLVVSGETGCGKTTQVPQFILDDAIRSGVGARCSIVVTQPRRLAAIGVATRVAAERAERVGETVGYSVRLESRRSARTRLLFCTTGVLLRRMQADTELEGVSHVLVDEVHERTVDGDFLLVVLRELLRRRPELRVVLMSATINAGIFADYFDEGDAHVHAAGAPPPPPPPGLAQPRGAAQTAPPAAAPAPADAAAPAPLLHIPGTTHDVEERYLEEIFVETGYRPVDGSRFGRRADSVDGAAAAAGFFAGGAGVVEEGGAPRGSGAAAGVVDEAARVRYLASVHGAHLAREVLLALGRVDESQIDLDAAVACLRHLHRTEPADGSFLVFMPGMAEMNALLAELRRAEPTFGGARLRLIALHSALSTSDQQLAFERPPPGVRKVVVATDIAETSITIDDVVAVVDSGRAKCMQYDVANRLPRLVLEWISGASRRQRRGRAGRVRAGSCWALYTRARAAALAPFGTPEIQRVPLHELCLQIKMLGLGDVRDFLRRALEPPSDEAVLEAVQTLEQFQAIDRAELLTPLGYHLASLPVDIRLGKMLLYACMLRCLHPVVVIVAICAGGRSPLLVPLDKRAEASKAHRAFGSRDPYSDHLLLLELHSRWRQVAAGGAHAEREWASANFVSAQALRAAEPLMQQFVALLREIGFLDADELGAAGGDAAAERAEGAAGAGRGGRAARRGAARAGSGRGGAERGGAGALLGGRAYNAHSANAEMVRAVLCAGLYPNVVSVTKPPAEPAAAGRGARGRGRGRRGRAGQPQRPHFETEVHARVTVHPLSIVAEQTALPTPFLVYGGVVKTTKTYVRELTPASPFALLLFGGRVRVEHSQSLVSLDDGFVRFTMAAKMAVLTRQLRAELDRLLLQKIEQPALELDPNGRVLGTIVRLLNSDADARQHSGGVHVIVDGKELRFGAGAAEGGAAGGAAPPAAPSAAQWPAPIPSPACPAAEQAVAQRSWELGHERRAREEAEEKRVATTRADLTLVSGSDWDAFMQSAMELLDEGEAERPRQRRPPA